MEKQKYKIDLFVDINQLTFVYFDANKVLIRVYIYIYSEVIVLYET
jgi:hypothetical protein